MESRTVAPPNVVTEGTLPAQLRSGNQAAHSGLAGLRSRDDLRGPAAGASETEEQKGCTEMDHQNFARVSFRSLSEHSAVPVLLKPHEAGGSGEGLL